MATRDIIVVGASAGGVEVLCQLARGLPSGFPAAVVVVCHVPPAAHSVLPDILSRQGPLLARHPTGAEPIYPGQIYVAPPDYHLLLKDGQVQLSHGPRENHHRPAIDPLFRSAARAYGPRVIGVVLTGSLYDGTSGLLAIRSAGGVAVVQDPSDAAVAAMPRSARDIAGADHVVTAANLAPLLIELVRGVSTTTGGPVVDDLSERMNRIVADDMTTQVRGAKVGEISLFTCPECGGCMWQVGDGAPLRFRCHVGHAYQAEALLEEQTTALEAALWTAVRTFKEKCLLSRQLALREREAGNPDSAQRFEEDAKQTEQYGALIQQYLLRAPGANNGHGLFDPPPE